MPGWQFPCGSRWASLNSISMSATRSSNSGMTSPMLSFSARMLVLSTSTASWICALLMFSGPLKWMMWNTMGMINTSSVTQTRAAFWVSASSWASAAEDNARSSGRRKKRARPASCKATRDGWSCSSCWPKRRDRRERQKSATRAGRERVGFIKRSVELSCRADKIQPAREEQAKRPSGCVVTAANRLDGPPVATQHWPLPEWGRASSRAGPPAHNGREGGIECPIEAGSVDPPGRQNHFRATLPFHWPRCIPQCPPRFAIGKRYVRNTYKLEYG